MSVARSAVVLEVNHGEATLDGTVTPTVAGSGCPYADDDDPRNIGRRPYCLSPLPTLVSHLLLPRLGLLRVLPRGLMAFALSLTGSHGKFVNLSTLFTFTTLKGPEFTSSLDVISAAGGTLRARDCACVDTDN